MVRFQLVNDRDRGDEVVRFADNEPIIDVARSVSGFKDQSVSGFKYNTTYNTARTQVVQIIHYSINPNTAGNDITTDKSYKAPFSNTS